MTNEAKEYSEQRILAIPADVNEDGQVFYLNEDLGTADDNGLAGEIEMAFNNGYGVALLKVKEYLETISKICIVLDRFRLIPAQKKETQQQ